MTLGLFVIVRVCVVLSGQQVDTMIVQAIGLLDELDKEINTYAMRVKEWFGWHFPEMAKVRLSWPYLRPVKSLGTDETFNFVSLFEQCRVPGKAGIFPWTSLIQGPLL